MSKSGVPFVETYRPKKFDDIVLDPLNKQILKNIIDKSYFPNLLFYGPPGTGKTTTIINLINAYQTKKDKESNLKYNAPKKAALKAKVYNFLERIIFNIQPFFTFL